jgi:hypothetical protein
MDQLKHFYLSFLDKYEEIEKWKKIERNIQPTAYDFLTLFLIEKMNYVKYETMIESIKIQISKLNPETSFVLFFPISHPFKIGSENLIILECFLELSKINITNIISQPSTDNIKNLLIIDDSIYTGRNTKHIIKCFPSVDNFSIITFSELSEKYNIFFYNDYKYENFFDTLFFGFHKKISMMK